MQFASSNKVRNFDEVCVCYNMICRNMSLTSFMIPAYGRDIKANSRFKTRSNHNYVKLFNVDMNGQKLVKFDALSCFYIRLKYTVLVWLSYQHQ